MNWRHGFAGIEIFALAALPAWMQSPTGTYFLHSHVAIADLVASAYVGFRSVQLALKVQSRPTPPAEPAKE